MRFAWARLVVGDPGAMASAAPGKHDKPAPPAGGSRVHPPPPGKHDTHRDARRGSHVHPAGEGISRVCARLGGAQQGVVTRRQLLSAGVSRHAIDHALSRGHLHPRHRGVYVVGHLALAQFAQEAAALLACGDGALISHRSAAYLWGLLPDRPARPVVTVVGHNCGCKPGISVHRVARIESRDHRRRHGLRVTSPSRTVIDLASDAGERELERVIAEGRVQRLLRGGELERALERAGSRKGAARLRALLRAEGEPGITRSDAERLLRRYLRDARLLQPKSNRKVEGWEVDFVWPQHRFVVEVDGYRFHHHRAAFERDRRKDMALAAAGYLVIRVSMRQLVQEPFAVIAHIARALERATRSHS